MAFTIRPGCQVTHARENLNKMSITSTQSIFSMSVFENKDVLQNNFKFERFVFKSLWLQHSSIVLNTGFVITF
jgi:hypothetical protein